MERHDEGFPTPGLTLRPVSKQPPPATKKEMTRSDAATFALLSEVSLCVLLFAVMRPNIIVCPLYLGDLLCSTASLDVLRTFLFLQAQLSIAAVLTWRDPLGSNFQKGWNTHRNEILHRSCA